MLQCNVHPAHVSGVVFGDQTLHTFSIALLLTLGCGLCMWLPLRGNRELRGGDGFLITALFYLGLGLFGAIPFLLTPI